MGVSTNDITGYSSYLKSQGVSDEDVEGYTKYLADEHGVKHPSEVATPDQIDKTIKAGAARQRESGDVANDALMDMLTLGHLPQIKAKIGQVLSGEGIDNDDNYLKRRDATINEMRSGAEKYPVANIEGKTAGVVLPMLATSGGSAVAEGAELAPLTTRVARGAVQGAKTGATYGLLSNPGDVEGKIDPLQMKERLEGAKTGMEFGAGVGGGLPLAGAGLRAAAGPAKWAAQKAGKIFANVPEETTARYLENPTAISSAPARDEISQQIMTMKGGADKELASAHEDFGNAKVALAEAKTDASRGLQDQKFDTQQAVSDASEALAEKKQKFKEALQSNNLTAMSSEATGAVQELRKQISEGSQQGFEILQKSGAKVSIDPVIKELQGHIDSMKINGVPKSLEAAKTIESLRDEQMRLFNMTKSGGGELSGPQAKEMLQAYDQQTSYPRGPGEFNDLQNGALKAARRTLDQTVKSSVPEYADHMVGVARKTRLLGETAPLYGDPGKAIQNLNNLDSEKGQALHVPLLAELEKETGKDLTKPVAGYLLNQKVLATPSLFDQTIENLPEAKTLRAAQAKKIQISDPEYGRQLVEKALEGPTKQVSAAEERLSGAKGKSDLYSGITENSVTGKQKALNGANSFGANAQLERIDNASGTNFREQIQNRNDLDQFSKSDVHGSRKTMLGGALGGIVGLITGHPILGVEMGGVVGGAADRYSGPMFKGALKAGMATGKIANQTGQALERANAGPGVGASMRAKASMAPLLGPQRWIADGYQKLLDHADADDREDLEAAKDKLMSDKNGKDLLIKASDLNVGSKAMDNMLARIKRIGGSK